MTLSNKFMENYRSFCTNSKTRLKVKTMSRDKILDFNADRLGAEDWQPLIKALRSDRMLHTLAIKSDYVWQNTDVRKGSLRKIPNSETSKPALFKPVITNEVVEAIGECMRRSDILSTVHLQALPLSQNNLNILSNAIIKCKILQNLILSRFELGDDGLNIVYSSIESHTRLNMINLSGCSLTKRGAQTIARLIRTQRLARYDETWKQSLRYRTPNQDVVPGIRRITLNDNPSIGDEGFLAICHELMDDLWIKAIDMRNCGLTNTSLNSAKDLLKLNDTITVLDLNKNSGIADDEIMKIKVFLKEREQNYCSNTLTNNCQHFEWLESKSDLTYLVSRDSKRKLTSKSSIITSKKQPVVRTSLIKNFIKNDSELTVALNQTKRDLNNTKIYLVKEREKREELEKDKNQQLTKMAEKFSKELNRRKRIEMERDRLRRELQVIASDPNLIKAVKSRKSLQSIKSKKGNEKSVNSLSSKSDSNPKSSKSKGLKSSDKIRTINSYFSSNKRRVSKQTVKKQCTVTMRSSANKLKVSKQSLKKQNAVNAYESDYEADYEIDNKNHLQRMQKNLDKLNNSVKSPSHLILMPTPTPTYNIETAKYSEESININYQTTEDIKTLQAEDDTDKNAENVRVSPNINVRDLSPISRSKYIFNEILRGNTRNK